MLLTFLVAFFSLIILMIIHEFGHFIIAKKFGVKVEEFGIGYPPKIFSKQIGETLYSVNLVPLGAFVKIYGEESNIDDYRSFSNLAIWKRVFIVLGGVIAFWFAAAVIFSVVFGIGATIPVGDQDIQGITSTTVKVIDVVNNSPAKTAGLKPGDTLVSIKNQTQGITVNKVADFQDFVANNKGKEVTITINRGGNNTDVILTPRVSYPDDQGPTGVSLERLGNVIQKYPWYQAPLKGIAYTGEITWQAMAGIYGVIASLIGGKGVPQGAELAGPIGITIFLSRAADFGAGFFLYFIGSLTVLLAIFNLFPIPALDGGKLIFLVIEKIKKRPVSVKVEQTVTIIFFLLLITMSIFITVKFDIPRVIDFWKASL